jgi:hypothetical protein
MSERIKLYLDEDAQRTDLIQALRARQIDIVTASDADLLGQTDDIQLQFAADQGRVIFTFNRGDFFRLHTEWLGSNRHHTGIIISDQVGTGMITRRLLRLADAKSASDMQDHLEFLSNWR